MKQNDAVFEQNGFLSPDHSFNRSFDRSMIVPKPFMTVQNCSMTVQTVQGSLTIHLPFIRMNSTVLGQTKNRPSLV